MGKIRPGNKKNSQLNGEFATHVRGKEKKRTSRLRRIDGKKDIDDRIKEK